MEIKKKFKEGVRYHVGDFNAYEGQNIRDNLEKMFERTCYRALEEAENDCVAVTFFLRKTRYDSEFVYGDTVSLEKAIRMYGNLVFATVTAIYDPKEGKNYCTIQYNDSFVQPVEERNEIQRGRFNYMLTFLLDEELSEIEKIRLQSKIQERLANACEEIKSEYPVKRWLVADDELISDKLKG